MTGERSFIEACSVVFRELQDFQDIHIFNVPYSYLQFIPFVGAIRDRLSHSGDRVDTLNNKYLNNRNRENRPVLLIVSEILLERVNSGMCKYLWLEQLLAKEHAL